MIPYQDILRVPFMDGGRTPETGFDCWGLVRFLLERAGHKDLPDFAYQTACNPEDVAALIEQERRNHTQATTDHEVGAVVVMRGAPAEYNHLGLIVAPKRMIHVDRRQGVVVQRTDRPPWSKRILGCYRWPILL